MRRQRLREELLQPGREVDEVPGGRVGDVEAAAEGPRRRPGTQEARLLLLLVRGEVAAGEVGPGLGPAQRDGGAVVGERGVDGGVVGAEPHPRLLPRVADLRRVPAPRPLPHPAVVPLRRRVRPPSRPGTAASDAAAAPVVPPRLRQHLHDAASPSPSLASSLHSMAGECGGVSPKNPGWRVVALIRSGRPGGRDGHAA
uniref:Uncharacterized protein n=1 Tax=Triticum urartu TaxID=4572 RepID=A0A8R7P4S4_TRIUA